jgi:hypothetical protein
MVLYAVSCDGDNDLDLRQWVQSWAGLNHQLDGQREPDENPKLRRMAENAQHNHWWPLLSVCRDTDRIPTHDA